MEPLRRVASSVLVASCAVIAACGTQSGKRCTLMACADEGLRVDFTETQPGAYVIEAVIDGSTTRCSERLPLASAGGNVCDSPDVSLFRTGGALPASQQSLGGLTVSRLHVQSITVRVTRDGQLVREATLAPSYTVTPGPNGPDCDPEGCRSAVATLP